MPVAELLRTVRTLLGRQPDTEQFPGPTARETVENQLHSAEWELKFAGGRVINDAQEKFDYDPFGHGALGETPSGYQHYVDIRLREQKHELFHDDPWLAEAYRRRDHQRAKDTMFARRSDFESAWGDDSMQLTEWYRRHPSRPGDTRIGLIGRRKRRANYHE